jgi:hypothetical protein
MLNHPHRNLQALLSTGEPGDDTVFSSYREAYNSCCDHCDDYGNHYYSGILEVEEDDEFEPRDNKEEEELTEAAWLLAKELPNRRLSGDAAPFLSNRTIDLLYN